MKRINKIDLEIKVLRLNMITKSPIASYVEVPVERYKKFIAQIGNYHLDWAYGKVALNRMTSEGGSVNRVFGYSSKAELYALIDAYMSGVLAVQS